MWEVSYIPKHLVFPEAWVLVMNGISFKIVFGLMVFGVVLATRHFLSFRLGAEVDL